MVILVVFRNNFVIVPNVPSRGSVYDFLWFFRMPKLSLIITSKALDQWQVNLRKYQLIIIPITVSIICKVCLVLIS